MTRKNKHIAEYLEYYSSLQFSPEFAVMVKGAWGSGKTWFVTQMMRDLKSKGYESLYCSLYGITRFEEIEDNFFRQMHPLLSSETLQLTGKIVQHTLRSSFDLNSAEKTLPSYLQHSDQHILFFDDLERCKIPVDELMGYLNDFVEHKGLKVIIALNEDEIRDRTGYNRIKDKLVGQTFVIASDPENALQRFLSYVQNPTLQEFLLAESESIITLYLKAGYDNLRHLKQAIMDFERMYDLLSAKAQQIPALLRTLLKEHLAFSFEIRYGALNPDEIVNLAYVHNRPDFDDMEDKHYKGHLEAFIEKYPEIEAVTPTMGLQNMATFFKTGFIGKEQLAASVANSKFLIHESEHEWLKLWYYYDLTDESFHKIFSQVQQNYINKKYTHADELLHVYGLFLEFAFNNLYDTDASAIVEEAKEYIKQLKEEQRLFDTEQSESEENSFAQLPYHASDTPEFIQIRDYLETMRQEAIVEQMPQITHNLLILMRTDTTQFWNMVCEPVRDSYYDQVVFPYIDPKTFVKHFMRVSDMKMVSAAIKQRYRSEFLNATLREELGWLKAVRELLMTESHRKQGALSGYVLLKCIQKGFDAAIAQLERSNVDEFLARC